MARNSRRDFLKTVSVGSVAAGLLRPTITLAQPPAALGPGDVPVALTVNGVVHQLSIEPRTTLLDALRGRLDLTGAKRVCDRGVCGACTVIIDGRTYNACALLAIEVQGRNIRTIEGAGRAGALHPVQQAVCDRDALMCGFCTPGCVMAAIALRERQPAPTADQARRMLDGHSCRCGANRGLLRAAAGV